MSKGDTWRRYKDISRDPFKEYQSRKKMSHLTSERSNKIVDYSHTRDEPVRVRKLFQDLETDDGVPSSEISGTCLKLPRVYESPDPDRELTDEEIRRRYKDTSLEIFKEQKNRMETNYLSFGTSCNTIEYSNNGNQPVRIRKPLQASNGGVVFSSGISGTYSSKAQKSCVIL